MAGSGDRRVSVDGEVEFTLSEGVGDASVRERIEGGARARATVPPPLALRRTSTLAADLDALGAAIDQLRDRMSHFGEVSTGRGGGAGRLEVGLKSVLRKLVQRHIDQEKEVHEALTIVLDRLTDVVRAQHVLLDENVTILTEDAERRDRRQRGE